MGYAENCLPKALAKLGAEVHLVVLPLAPYYYMSDFENTYGQFNKTRACGSTTEIVDGYSVHYLEPQWIFGKVRMRGLPKKLRELRPQIVQTFVVNSWIPLEAAFYRSMLNYKLFTASSYQASVFPLAQRDLPFWHPERLHAFFLRAIPGRLISLVSEACYGATEDCSEVAVRFFGIQANKVKTDPLGVDTDIFYPVSEPLGRAKIRSEFGFTPNEIVCVYSGRFSEGKNPLILAKAIETLRAEGMPYRALFIGNGVQQSAIDACPGSVTHPFVEFRELGSIYRACDIAVWPTQESTSMLDAAACGLPLVVNNTIQAIERIDGNGATYRLNDVDDLARVLLGMLELEVRASLGRAGAKKMASQFSWNLIAERRLQAYLKSLGGY